MLTGKIAPQEHILKPHQKSISEKIFPLCNHQGLCNKDNSPVFPNHQKQKISFKKNLQKSMIPQDRIHQESMPIPKKIQKISVSQSSGLKFQGDDSYRIHLANHPIDDSYIRSTKYPTTANQNSYPNIRIRYYAEPVSAMLKPSNKKIQNAPALQYKEKKQEQLFAEMHELKNIQSLATFAPKYPLSPKLSLYGSNVNKKSLNFSQNIKGVVDTANINLKTAQGASKRKLQTKTTIGNSGLTNNSINIQHRSTEFNKQLVTHRKIKEGRSQAWNMVRKTQTLKDQLDQDLNQSTVIEDFASLMNKVRENRLEAWDISEQLIQI